MDEDDVILMERPLIQAVLEKFFASRGLLEIALERQQNFVSTLVHLGELPESDAPPHRSALSLHLPSGTCRRQSGHPPEPRHSRTLFRGIEPL